jgi:hypothetical protein
VGARPEDDGRRGCRPGARRPELSRGDPALNKSASSAIVATLRPHAKNGLRGRAHLRDLNAADNQQLAASHDEVPCVVGVEDIGPSVAPAIFRNLVCVDGVFDQPRRMSANRGARRNRAWMVTTRTTSSWVPQWLLKRSPPVRSTSFAGTSESWSGVVTLPSYAILGYAPGTP